MRITDAELGAALRVAKKNAVRECKRCLVRPKRFAITGFICGDEGCVYGWIHRIHTTAVRRSKEARRAKEKP